ncbi:MAG: hypothetical protein CVU87_12305 [Firmicutes bacterium HGW-Firmicutes-12]|jgi:hypothetical protein|nr:MAG: hypothetical protein CVU87_12305 [Firmicutes bacterium HGW-Firmicutes-12]
MRKIVLTLSILLLLAVLVSACSSLNNFSSGNPSKPPIEDNPGNIETSVYIPDHPLTMNETIEQFFDQQYNAYTQLQYIDISCLLDTSQVINHNSLVWLESLIQRRKLIAEQDLCFVETTQYSYSISYVEEPDDERMEFWQRRGLNNEDEVIVHFRVSGEKAHTYPPFLGMNSMHTMRLKQIEDVWKITSHYYPGSSRFRDSTPFELTSYEEMLDNLLKEFQAFSQVNPIDKTAYPAKASPFSGERATQYANLYTVSPNPIFYDIDDWMGNCANFTSQCLWFGFGESMTSKWYAGQGGGSPAWESVENFWNYVTSARGAQEQGLHGEVAETIRQLDIGGIVQTRAARYRNTNEPYSHNLLLVDPSTLLLAQNSPDCFIYYSDIVNTDNRFFNPRYLVEN